MSVVDEVLRNEAINFGMFGIVVILFGMYWHYIITRWSWIPRRKQRRGFGERF